MKTAIPDVPGDVLAASPVVFEMRAGKWHMRIHRAANGLAIIHRVACPKYLKPGSWISPDQTPKSWVALQRKPEAYRRVEGNA